MKFNRINFNCGIFSSLMVVFLVWINPITNLSTSFGWFIFLILFNVFSAILNFNVAFEK